MTKERSTAQEQPYVKRYGENNAACKEQPLPWWVLKTSRWGSYTRVAPFWCLDHYVNIATQIRGWWWVQREGWLDR